MRFYGVRAKIHRYLTVLLGSACSRLPLTPNQWTLLGLLPSLVAIWSLARHAWLISATLVLVSLLVDAIDGAVARATGKSTTFGAFLDALVDRYAEAALMTGLLLADLPDVLLPAACWIFFYYFGSMMSTYAKAVAKEKDYVDEEVGGGLAGRGEKMIALAAGMIAASFEPVYLTYFLIVVGALAHLTAVQRMARAGRLHAQMRARGEASPEVPG
jgi:phosphatidylglycerophosphate synthase